jgi:tellurite methyltransferase
MSEAERTTWDARYRDGSHTGTEPSKVLVALEELFPTGGRAPAGCFAPASTPSSEARVPPAANPRALDVGGGAGRHALWLARKGFDVTIADISEVGLAIARERALAQGLALETVAVDLENQPLPTGPWDLIVVFHFLYRPLFQAFSSVLAPGGGLAVVHPTRSNLARFDKPSARFLLEDGELPGLVRDLTMVRHDEGWLEDGRHEARLLARNGR